MALFGKFLGAKLCGLDPGDLAVVTTADACKLEEARSRSFRFTMADYGDRMQFDARTKREDRWKRHYRVRLPAAAAAQEAQVWCPMPSFLCWAVSLSVACPLHDVLRNLADLTKRPS